VTLAYPVLVLLLRQKNAPGREITLLYGQLIRIQHLANEGQVVDYCGLISRVLTPEMISGNDAKPSTAYHNDHRHPKNQRRPWLEA